VNNRIIGVGEFKYAIRIFKGGKEVAMTTKFSPKYAKITSDFTSLQDIGNLSVNNRVIGGR